MGNSEVCKTMNEELKLTDKVKVIKGEYKGKRGHVVGFSQDYPGIIKIELKKIWLNIRVAIPKDYLEVLE